MAFNYDVINRPVALPLGNIGSLTVRLLNWLIALDDKYRQARQMDELTNDQRIDMGMPCRIDPPRLPDEGW